VAPDCIATLKQHKHPPEAILDDLQHFLTPGCINACRTVMKNFEKKREQKMGQIFVLKNELKDVRAKSKEEDDSTKKKKKGEKGAKTKKSVKSSSSKKSEAEIQKKINHLQEGLKTTGKDLMVALVGQMSKPGAFKKSVTCVDGKEACFSLLLLLLLNFELYDNDRSCQ